MATETLKLPGNDARAKRMVDESALVLKRLYFLQRELVLMQAGWLPAVEHWQSKLTVPEYLWRDSLIAAALRERVLELRYPERRLEIGQDDVVLSLWKRAINAPNPLAFLSGLHRVLKPAMQSAFSSYLAVADLIGDGPTLLILKDGLRAAEEQIEGWTSLLADYRTFYPEHTAEADAWCASLSRMMEVTAPHLNNVGTSSALDGLTTAPDGQVPFQRAELGLVDKRFKKMVFAWPDFLDPSRGPGEGLELQVRQAQAHINEIWASCDVAAALHALADQAPHEFVDDLARWTYDESRHCRMGWARLSSWNLAMEEMPMGSFVYDAGAGEDPLIRMCMVYMFESSFIGTKPERAKTFAAFGDRASSHDMDFDWADELIHVHYGKKWLGYFLDLRKAGETPNDFRRHAEACADRVRAALSEEERQATESTYAKTMAKARQLAEAHVLS